MKIIPFEEWLTNNADLAKRCTRCEGRGSTKCPHCNGIITCKTCGGEGKVGIKRAREVYEQEMDKVIRAINLGLLKLQSNDEEIVTTGD